MRTENRKSEANDLIGVYKCLADTQRLRILNLLCEGPLCVCHLMEILNADQVKISKQLQYMKKLGILESRRSAQWRIYKIAEQKSPLLAENLRCLQAYGSDDLRFAEDLETMRAVLAEADERAVSACCR